MTRIILVLAALALTLASTSGASACQRASSSCLVKSFTGGATARPAPLPQPRPVTHAGRGAGAARNVTEKFADQARQTSRKVGDIGRAVSSGALSPEKVKGIGTSIGKLKSAAGAAQKADDHQSARVIGSQIRKAEDAQAAARTRALQQSGTATSPNSQYFNRGAAGQDLAGANRPADKVRHARQENLYKSRKQHGARERQRARQPAIKAGHGLSNPPKSAQSAFDKTKKRKPMRPAFNKAASRQGSAQASGTQTGDSGTGYPSLELY